MICLKAEQARLFKTAEMIPEEHDITDGSSDTTSSTSGSHAELRIRMPDGQVA